MLLMFQKDTRATSKAAKVDKPDSTHDDKRCGYKYYKRILGVRHDAYSNYLGNWGIIGRPGKKRWPRQSPADAPLSVSKCAPRLQKILESSNSQPCRFTDESTGKLRTKKKYTSKLTAMKEHTPISRNFNVSSTTTTNVTHQEQDPVRIDIAEILNALPSIMAELQPEYQIATNTLQYYNTVAGPKVSSELSPGSPTWASGFCPVQFSGECRL
jgi:hypothetical protein